MSPEMPAIADGFCYFPIPVVRRSPCWENPGEREWWFSCTACYNKGEQVVTAISLLHVAAEKYKNLLLLTCVSYAPQMAHFTRNTIFETIASFCPIFSSTFWGPKAGQEVLLEKPSQPPVLVKPLDCGWGSEFLSQNLMIFGMWWIHLQIHICIHKIT